MKKIPIRLMLTFSATLVEEIAIVLIVLLVLPRFGIHIPRPGFIGMIVGLAVWGVVSYRFASRALRKKPMIGSTTMVGSRGKVVSPLVPGGVIKIGDELWEAKSAGRKINTGEEVIVVGQDKLKLVVRKSSAGDLEEIE